jgi:hypothetical protein
MFYKIAAIVILFLGEALSVYAEMIAARAHTSTNHSFMAIFFKGFIMIVFAGAFLIVGYMLGYKFFKNIWVVSALSITSILIMEPLIGYLVFQQLPTRGAVLGLILGAAGFVAAFIS